MLKKRKKEGNFFGLKPRFLTYIIGGIILMGGLFSVNHIYKTNKLLTMELEEKGGVLARSLANYSKYGVLIQHKGILNQLLANVIREEDVNSAIIYDPHGEILAKMTELQQDVPVFKYKEIERMDFERGFYVSYYQDKTLPLLNIVAPIITAQMVKTGSKWGSEEQLLELGEEYERFQFREGATVAIGYVQVTMSLQKLIQEKKATIRSGFLITLLITGVMTIFSFLFVRRMVRPVEVMSRTATEIAQGNLALRINKYSHDEIGILGDCFNRMVDSLEKRDFEIRQLNQELEKRVERRTAELKLVHEQLLHAEKLSALGKLSASIAHEFNNPLYGIRMVSEELAEKPDRSEDELKSIQLALRESKRISHLIKNLQDFYQPSSGVAMPLDIHQALEDTLEICKKKLMLSDIKVVRRFADNLPPIMAVPDQIKQVFLNLITNAEEAMLPSGGTLTVQTRALDSRVLIIFRDTGCGIAKENMERIFDPFFTTKRAVKGTGLGLSVSYGIIKKHGGNILVQSAPHEGSIFTIELPV